MIPIIGDYIAYHVLFSGRIAFCNCERFCCKKYFGHIP
jgi:uncharacterized OsmC-like protein